MTKLWTSKELVRYGQWLYDHTQYKVYGLFLIHGCCFGLKIGDQLKLRWSDLINHDGSSKEFLTVRNTKVMINKYCTWINRVSFKSVSNSNLNSFVYRDHYTKHMLCTSNLNKNLQRYHKKYLNWCEEEYNEPQPINKTTIKSESPKLAWALDMVEHYRYSKNAFIEVSKHLGHRTVKDTIARLKVKPQVIEMKFDFI